MDFLPLDVTLLVFIELPAVAIGQLFKAHRMFSSMLEPPEGLTEHPFWRSYFVRWFGELSFVRRAPPLFRPVVTKQAPKLQQLSSSADPQFYTQLISRAASQGFYKALPLILKSMPPGMIIAPERCNFPLHQAAAAGCIEAVEALMQHGFDPQTFGPTGIVVHVAAQHGRIEVLMLLCPTEIATNPALLQKAMDSKKEAPIIQMIQTTHAANVIPMPITLSLAAKNGLFQVVGKLLELWPTGFSIPDAIYHAIDSSNLPMVKCLVDSQIKPDSVDDQAAMELFDGGKIKSNSFLAACTRSDTPIVTWALERFPILITTRSSKMMNPLHAVARPANWTGTIETGLDLIDYVISKDPSLVSELDSNERCCLTGSFTSTKFHKEVAEHLVSRGAPIDHLTFIMALRTANTSCVEWVLKRFDRSKYKKEEPFYIFELFKGGCARGTSGVVKLLASQGFPLFHEEPDNPDWPYAVHHYMLRSGQEYYKNVQVFEILACGLTNEQIFKVPYFLHRCRCRFHRRPPWLDLPEDSLEYPPDEEKLFLQYWEKRGVPSTSHHFDEEPGNHVW